MYGLKTFGWLKKMKLCFCLVGVLLFFLLGFSSSVYAKLLTDNDIKNLISNISMKQNGTSDISQGLRDYLNQNDTMVSYVRTKLNENEGKYIISQTDNNTIRFWYYTNGNQKAYMYGNNVNINTSYTSAYAIRFMFNNNIGFMENDFYSIGNIDIWTMNTYYTDTNIYSNGSYSNISYQAGTIRPVGFDIFDDVIYKSDYFSYIANSSLGLINIDFINDLVYEVTPSDYNNFLCTIGLKENLGNIIFNQYYYDNDVGDFLNFRSVNGYDFYNDDSDSVYLYLKQAYDIKNTLILFVIQPDFTLDKDYSSLYFYCYLSDNNTVITDGNLDVSDTFKGSYYNDYLYKIKSVSSGGAIYNDSGDVTGYIDLDPIKNSIDNLLSSSDVDYVLGEYMTSGEILGSMNYTTYGDEYHNGYSVPIMYFFNKINDVLLESGDVYFDIPLRTGGFKRIYSSDFYVPENNLKTFISLFMVFSTVFVLYLHFKNLIEDINAGDGFKFLGKEQVDMNIVKM